MQKKIYKKDGINFLIKRNFSESRKIKKLDIFFFVFAI